MKSIINGKRFDTDTADHLATASSPLGRSDYGWWQEGLYRTKRSKTYFLAGEGHAASRYARSLGGGAWAPGEKITPLTDNEAFDWAQRHLPADRIEDA